MEFKLTMVTMTLHGITRTGFFMLPRSANEQIHISGAKFDSMAEQLFGRKIDRGLTISFG